MKSSDSSGNKAPSPVYLVAGVTIVAAVFYIGFLVGNVTGARSVVPQGEGRVVNKGAATSTVTEDVDFTLFWDVWNLVKDHYLDRPVSEKDLFYGALEGMLNSLEDPHSVFLDPELANAFNAELDGTFFGIGAEIGPGENYVVVVAPLAESPAQRAGLVSGDEIIAIDGVDAFNMTVTEAVTRIRGDEGTEVILSIFREGADDLFDIPITRGEIKISSVEWEVREDGIGVIEVFMFNEETTSLFQDAVQELLEADVDGIVLDLRNNPGGLLSEAINLAGFWINGKTVVIQQVVDDRREFSAGGAARLAGIPTVVLVNGGSASSSEILAGALQDYGVATILGEQTFGKGSVQEYYDYADGSAVKITVSEWLTPEGNSIDGIGITPDIVVEFTLEDFDAQKTPQFDAAINYLTESP